MASQELEVEFYNASSAAFSYHHLLEPLPVPYRIVVTILYIDLFAVGISGNATGPGLSGWSTRPKHLPFTIAIPD
ncbi:hypothetical protein BV898_11452 [Hypsibius exemplaris]|uniref:Uncharacterized protein n=1 Tax=Hypsibius exemplaris TaxID=2072580 RepID=A0A1W0WGK7_HYPEX|nr:hypothetical protein BV898_11452 [Hypsibius exemplaris]